MDAIAGVLILGRLSDALLGRGWLHGRVLVGDSANFAAAVAFLIGLSALFLNGIIMRLALRTYQPDVAAAIASAEGEEALGSK